MTFSRIHHVIGAEKRRHGEGEKGVPGGHALSLYNIVSFEKFPSRKNARNLEEPLSRVPQAIDFVSLPKYDSPPQALPTNVTRHAT